MLGVLVVIGFGSVAGRMAGAMGLYLISNVVSIIIG